MSSTKKIVVLGGKESGTGAALLALKKGYDVWVSDLSEIPTKYKKVLSNNKIKWEEGQHSEDLILDADEIIKSPGIPEKAPLIQKALHKGIPVVSEIEFAGRFSKGKTICITGSNGKTTTTMLIGHILKNAGLDVAIAGNVGKSFAGQLAESDHEYWVLELSSFQLDGMFDFKADLAILLNITPDHLDRYGYELQNYVDSKFRIIQNMTENDSFIFWNEDPIIENEIKKRKPNVKMIPFGWEEPKRTKGYDSKAFTLDDQIIIRTNNNQLNMRIHELALQGKHNVYNSMASGLASRTLELKKEVVRESLTNFTNIEHRLEFVAKVAGITFINDSKATNINSTWYALESIDAQLIWILGGVDKGNDYSELYEMVTDKVKAIICLGKDNSKIIEAFKDKVDAIYETQSAKDAVTMAYDLGHKEDVVLLSPACASFDLFDSYEERGQAFKKAVKAL